DDLASLLAQIQDQLPGESRTRLMQIQLAAEQGNKPQAIQMARTVLGRSPAPNEQVCMSVATASAKFALGLEEEAFARSEKLYGVTPTLAYSKAITGAFAGHAVQGLKDFDDLARKSGKGDDLPWRMARAQ